MAQAKEFIESKEEQFDTHLAEGEATFLVDRNNVYPLRVQLLKSRISISLMIPSQLLTTRQMLH